MFKNDGQIHVYSPGTGTGNFIGSAFLIYKHDPVLALVICCKFFFSIK